MGGRAMSRVVVFPQLPVMATTCPWKRRRTSLASACSAARVSGTSSAPRSQPAWRMAPLISGKPGGRGGSARVAGG